MERNRTLKSFQFVWSERPAGKLHLLSHNKMLSRKKKNRKIGVCVHYESQYRNTVDGTNDKIHGTQTGDPEDNDGKRRRVQNGKKVDMKTQNASKRSFGSRTRQK